MVQQSIVEKDCVANGGRQHNIVNAARYQLQAPTGKVLGRDHSPICDSRCSCTCVKGLRAYAHGKMKADEISREQVISIRHRAYIDLNLQVYTLIYLQMYWRYVCAYICRYICRYVCTSESNCRLINTLSISAFFGFPTPPLTYRSRSRKY